MNNGFNISDVILLSVTILIIKRLISVLGTTSQDAHYEDKPMKVVTPIEDEPKSGFSRLIGSCKELACRSDKSFKLDGLSEKARNAVEAIRRHDHSFEPRRFTKTIMSSHVALIQAMNSGDLAAIKDACSNKVYTQLASYIRQNKSRGFVVQQNISNYDAVDIIDAQQIGGRDYLKVKLQMQLIRMVYNRDGHLIVGNQHNSSTISDELMLRRDSAKSPWQIWEMGSSLTSNEIGSGE